MSNHIHIIARGIWVHNASILLAWHKEHQYYFFPGGHVEAGESAAAALEREIAEETGMRVTCGQFLALFEHAWENGDVLQHELTTLFTIEGTPAEATVQSQVEHLEFRWVPVEELAELHLLPSQIRGLIANVIAGESTPRFISTLRP